MSKKKVQLTEQRFKYSNKKPYYNTGEYYSCEKIDKENAEYSLIIGERSNGKTYNLLNKCLFEYCKNGVKSAYIRRWGEDFRQKRANSLFDPLIKNNLVSEYTEGKYTDIYYFGLCWYLCYYTDKGERIREEKPFMYAFSLNDMEHDKSTSYPDVDIVIFDEFLTRGRYLPNEFILFQNTLSTIIRLRDTVKIYMLANTVSQYSIYWEEMGIKNIKNMKQGTIDTYALGDMKIAIEYCSQMNEESKKSNKYFAFNNSHLQMIKHGGWEIDIYPHLPLDFEYKKEDILDYIFIEYDTELLQGDILTFKDTPFIYFHRKTTPIQADNKSLVYSPKNIIVTENMRRNILKPMSEGEKRILQLIKMENVCYQTNEIGELFRSYYQWCETYKQFK